VIMGEMGKYMETQELENGDIGDKSKSGYQ
jgi:hypothetical protein